MEGRSKSRFPEKCKNCIWGRFPSQFWRHFEATLAPKMHFFLKKEAPGNQLKKRTPPSLIWGRGVPKAKPDGSRKAPPSRQRVVWIIDKKQQQLNKNTNNCTIVASIDYLCSDSWLDFDFNVNYLHEVVEEVAASSWKKHSARDLTRPGQRPGEFCNKKPLAGLHHTKSQSGDATTNCF